MHQCFENFLIKLFTKRLYFFPLLLFLPIYSFAVGDISGTVTNDSGTPISGATIILYRNQTVIDSTTTNIDGTYSLTSISPGNYSILASAPSYQTATQGVNVKNNQTVTVNFSLLSNPGNITGTVTDANTMTAISGATVIAIQNSLIIATATTNAFGIYNIIGLAPGAYLLIAQASSYQTGAVGALVNSEQTTTANFALEINPGTLSGTVTSDFSGLPIENALIEVNLNNEVILSTLTAADGTYSISGITPGAYIIHAHAEGYQTAIVGAIITAGGTTTSDFSLMLSGGTLIGTVTSASTGNFVTNAIVEANLDNVTINSSLTDANGQYSIPNLPPGFYVIHVHAENYQMSLGAAEIEAEGITNVNFSLASDPGTISGTVVSATTGLPIPGALECSPFKVYHPV